MKLISIFNTVIVTSLFAASSAQAVAFTFTDLNSVAIQADGGNTPAFLTNDGIVYYTGVADPSTAYEIHNGKQMVLGGSGQLLGAANTGVVLRGDFYYAPGSPLVLRGATTFLAPDATAKLNPFFVQPSNYEAINNNFDAATVSISSPAYQTASNDVQGRSNLTAATNQPTGGTVVALSDNGFGTGFLASDKAYTLAYTSQFTPGSKTATYDSSQNVAPVQGLVTYSADFQNLAGVSGVGEISGSYLVPITGQTGPRVAHAFTGFNGILRDIGALGLSRDAVNGRSYAYDINATGDVVGSSTYGDPTSEFQHAFLYRGGKMVDLNTLIDPSLNVVIDAGLQINDAGQILVAYNDGQRPLIGVEKLALLTFAAPTASVPEPSTWAMLMIGFGTVGAAMRRRTDSGSRFAVTA